MVATIFWIALIGATLLTCVPRPADTTHQPHNTEG